MSLSKKRMSQLAESGLTGRVSCVGKLSVGPLEVLMCVHAPLLSPTRPDRRWEWGLPSEDIFQVQMVK